MFSLTTASLIFAVSGASTLLALAALLRLGSRFVSRTRAFRSEESGSPLLRLGGIAVFGGMLSGILAGLLASEYSGSLALATRYHWIGWIAGTGILFTLGLVDDLYGLGARAKFAVQIIGAVGVHACGFRIEFIELPGSGLVNLGWLSLPATVLWVVGVTNAINLIDGLDGLAAGIALMAAATIGTIAVIQGEFPVAVVSIAMAGSLLAFLKENAPPARIYLGDCGSQFIGFTLAVLSLRGLHKGATTVALLTPVLILGVPILDTILVILRRLWRIRRDERPSPGAWIRIRTWRGVFRRDREHVHFNLLDLGLSKRVAVVVLYLTAACLCLSALLLALGRSAVPAAVVLTGTIVEIAALKAWAVRRRSRVGAAPAAPGADFAAGAAVASEREC